MSSGRLAGISVKPLPRQSTTLLLQVQAEGQVMELALHDGGSDWAPETRKTWKGFKKSSCEILTTKYIRLWVLQILLLYKVILYLQVNVISYKSTAEKTYKRLLCSFSSSVSTYQSFSLMSTSLVTFMLTYINSL